MARKNGLSDHDWWALVAGGLIILVIGALLAWQAGDLSGAAAVVFGRTNRQQQCYFDACKLAKIQCSRPRLVITSCTSRQCDPALGPCSRATSQPTQSTPPAACQPIVCSKGKQLGKQFATCTPEGYPINYFINPCL